MIDALTQFIRDEFPEQETIALHTPDFSGNERRYVLDTIESTFVSSVGSFVDKFESCISNYTNSPHAVACVNGTSALHVALICSGVARDDLVITQAMTFVATCNAISYCGAEPVFVDVCRSSLSMCPEALKSWLETNCFLDKNLVCRHKTSKRIVKACVPVHIFGFVADMKQINTICENWNISVVEDAAEALGSYSDDKHAGTFSAFGVLSFNGNKIVTTGGGGIVLAATESTARKVKHLTTTAKKIEGYAMYHDELAYNYRMPNLNAALGLGQVERLELLVEKKRQRAERYMNLLADSNLKMVKEPSNTRANYWFVTAICENSAQKKHILDHLNDANILARPLWALMHRLPMYRSCERDNLDNSIFFEQRLINLPN